MAAKKECARTDTVFFPISQVCTTGVTLTITIISLLSGSKPLVMRTLRHAGIVQNVYERFSESFLLSLSYPPSSETLV